MSKIYEGNLLIADITGYTMYLSQSELEHAQEILSSLLKIIVQSIHPPLVISRLAGDAVVSYGLRDQAIQGQTFIEMIENIYIAFQSAIERMVLNNRCKCNACRNISTLDLKFFVHSGSFGRQEIGQYEELVGSDVNLIHRLLKNHVTERTGLTAYTLYTGAALHSIAKEELKQSMIPLTETYEHLGEVDVWVQDMHPAWDLKQKATNLSIPPEQVCAQGQVEIELSPEVTWNYLIQPQYRALLMHSDHEDVLHLDHGRINPGSVYHCYHGDEVIYQTVLDWRPFERIITEDTVPIPRTTILVEYRLEPTQRGTRLTHIFSKAKGPLFSRMLCDRILPGSVKDCEKDLLTFKEHIEGDWKAKGG
jgi:hypothetical protein